ncbi:MAG: hypothetical protein H0T42_08105 [Deltaproteobacteria bacterium]|nr:hypothetical protein [Deltaproteobacteria bacterium]
MVYASSLRAKWVQSELGRGNALIQFGGRIEHVVAALVEAPSPRPQVLVVDFDAIAVVDILQLHAVRDHGWCGRIIGLGVVPNALRRSLGIERVLNTPFVRDSLSDAIAEIGFEAQTSMIPVMHGDAGPANTLCAQPAEVVVARARTR